MTCASTHLVAVCTDRPPQQQAFAVLQGVQKQGSEEGNCQAQMHVVFSSHLLKSASFSAGHSACQLVCNSFDSMLTGLMLYMNTKQVFICSQCAFLPVNVFTVGL